MLQRRTTPMVQSCFLALAVLVGSAQADVRVVGGGGTSYPTIQAAVNAASDGDLILVRTGNYSTVSITNKELTITREAGAYVNIVGAIYVGNLSASRTVVLAGMNVTGPGALSLVNNDGAVRVVDGNFTAVQGAVGIQISNCQQVAFSRTSASGVNGQNQYSTCSGCPTNPPPTRGTTALQVANSSVALYGGYFQGGIGGWTQEAGTHGQPGGSGCEAHASFVFASRGTYVGGPGGDGGPGNYALPGGCGGDGGDGIGLIQSSTGYFLPNSYSPGAAGVSGNFAPCGPPQAGLPIDTQGSTSNLLSGRPRTLSVNYPLREGIPATLDVAGRPGDLAYVFVSAGTSFQYSPGSHGVVLTSVPLLRRHFLGTIPASGILQKYLYLPDLGPGVQNATWHLQAGFIDAGGLTHLADYRPLIRIDSAF